MQDRIWRGVDAPTTHIVCLPTFSCFGQANTYAVCGFVVCAAGFLSRFEGASCPAKLLEEITIIDTPGVLSGEKQRIERNYNVSTNACAHAMTAITCSFAVLCCVLHCKNQHGTAMQCVSHAAYMTSWVTSQQDNILQHLALP